jgi:phage repressor protein C with HTH and peptisase S24 domain/DNA-binding XRE family transcriptional regulator
VGAHEDLEQLHRLRQQVEEQLQGHDGFGRHLRRLRRDQGMTLDDLARASGISKAYLSQIETGQVDPPRDDKVRSLEQVFALRPGALLEPAHLARAPAELRERLQHLQSAFERAEETLQTVLEKLPAEDEAEGGPAKATSPGRGNVGKARPLRGRVPIINRVTAGYPAEFTDLGYPAGVADDYIGAPPGLEDANAFAVRVVGDSMAPRYREGDIVLFSPAMAVQSGDDCYVRFAPECREAQGATFKRVYFDGRSTVRLQPRNGQYPPTVVPLEQVTGIYKAAYRYETL